MVSSGICNSATGSVIAYRFRKQDSSNPHGVPVQSTVAQVSIFNRVMIHDDLQDKFNIESQYPYTLNYPLTTSFVLTIANPPYPLPKQRRLTHLLPIMHHEVILHA